MPRNRFYDAATGTEYLWTINHSEEDEQFEQTSVEATATANGVGLVRQQGDDAPLKLVYRGTIMDDAQHRQMVAWRRLCKTRSIQFSDYAGNVYEVLITAFRSQRQRVVWNPRGGTTARYHIWRYTLEMDVIRPITGAWS